jgi:hypothetical protein
VYFNVNWYDTPLKAYRKSADFTLDHVARITELESEIDDLDAEIEMSRLREKMYDAYIFDLSYTITIPGEFVIFQKLHHLNFKSLPTRDYQVTSPNPSVEVVNSTRSGSILERWESEVKDLRSEIDDKWRQSAQLTGELESTKAEYDSVQLLFDRLKY